MKVSVNWLKDFVEISENTQKLADKLTFGGLEVEAVEKFESIPGGLEGVVIGEVISCVKHPNADRLSLTQVDIGNEELSPIVCGAPNVAKGQKVLVATVGATLYPKGSEPFEIKKAKIRGEVSEGMICAEDELGIGDDHDGILVIETDLPNGSPARNYFEPYSDEVLEIGLTPNRGDASSHLGVARDIRALYKVPIRENIPSDWPEKSETKKIDVELVHPEACPRYAGIVISNLKIEDSPAWLQNKLRAIGLKPINNVVDVTNFILHDLGQPLHAFDYDKISGSKVVVKHGLKGTTFRTLDEVDRKLDAEDLMICDSEGPMCIGGVFGGINSGVSESTTSIFLESACFDPVFIRKTSQRHGLKTDAAFRFERGTDIDIVVKALRKAAKLLNEVAGGKLSSELIDLYPSPKEEATVNLRKKDIRRLLGIDIENSEVLQIFDNLDIRLESEDDSSWHFRIPNYRTEVTRPADLIEELLRIYGFNKVPVEKESGTSYLAPSVKSDPYIPENTITELLIGRNFNEIQTNSLTKESNTLLNQHFGESFQKAEILNKLSEELGVMRDNLMYSGLEVLKHNINRKQQNLRLFEFGFIYGKNKDGYSERRYLQISLSGMANEESWMSASANKPQDFFELKSVINSIFDRLGIDRPEFRSADYNFLEGGGFTLKSNDKILGWIGSPLKKLLKDYDINIPIWMSSLNMDLINSLGKRDILFREIPKFPEVRRDLSLVIDEKISFSEIYAIAEKLGGELITQIRIFDVFKGKPLEEGQKSYAITFVLLDPERTLEDKRIDHLMNKLIDTFEKELGAVIRR